MSDVRRWESGDVEDPGKGGDEWEPDDDNQITLPHNTYTLCTRCFSCFSLCLDPPKTRVFCAEHVRNFEFFLLLFLLFSSRFLQEGFRCGLLTTRCFLLLRT